MEPKTVFVLVTDNAYFHKAKRTIIDLRSIGNWQGDVVLITIDFILNENFRDLYKITTVQFPNIDKQELLNKIGEPFFDGDRREFHKLNQWEKLHVFDDYFLRWQRVVFIDAGLRIFDSVEYLLELDYKNAILAPNDAGHNNNPHKIFETQVSFYKPELIELIQQDFGEHILKSQYFLNCIWIYDTSILKICDKTQLINAMNKYPLCKTNEMTIMNLLFHFKYKLWKPFPIYNSNQKFLFDWCELNHLPKSLTWRDFCYIKYPVSINFDDM